MMENLKIILLVLVVFAALYAMGHCFLTWVEVISNLQYDPTFDLSNL